MSNCNDLQKTMFSHIGMFVGVEITSFVDKGHVNMLLLATTRWLAGPSKL